MDANRLSLALVCTLKIARTVHNGKVRFRLNWMLNGHQKRRFFKTRAEAEDHAATVEEEIQRHGIRWLEVDDAVRADCIAALEIARRHGFTLLSAVSEFAKGTQPTERAPEVSQAIARCIERKRSMNLKPRSLRCLEATLERFEGKFGPRVISTVTPQEIESWLNSFNHAAATRRGNRINLQTLFSYAVAMDWMHRNPVSRVPAPVLDDKPPSILTPDQAKKLMETCRDFDKGMVGFFALCLFCGIRTEEVLKLQRSAVDLARSIVTVDVGVSKTRRRRIVSIPENCLAWLKVECTLPVVNWQARYNAVREAAKLRSGWGQDCMRHSFGSYHYALTRDAAATAAEMGNSPEILFRHYRELVTREQAVEFFGIKP